MIEWFKREIIFYDDLKKHESYVPCTRLDKNNGHMLFVLRGRAEIIVKPDMKTHELYFTSCADN
ncbi:MAG: hypothetical protein EB830_00070 [Nitrosopumilus sp. H13]|nr:MAG: hypothetical protein EB830_00070 [Nitrosopumilus sp. H13]